MTVERPGVTAPGFRLLSVFDDVVTRDPAPPGLKARLAVAVRGRATRLWWVVDLAARASTVFTDVRPAGADVTVELGVDEAESVLLRGELPADPELVWLDGDRAILDRFLSRYFSTRDLLSLRSEQNR